VSEDEVTEYYNEIDKLESEGINVADMKKELENIKGTPLLI
jgi:hypothetical protein